MLTAAGVSGALIVGLYIFWKWYFPKSKFKGIPNVRQSCFFNSIMQILFYLRDFKQFVVANRRGDIPLIENIAILFEEMELEEESVGWYHYGNIVKSLGRSEIEIGTENCASEFLELLILGIAQREMAVKGLSSIDLFGMSVDDFGLIDKSLGTFKLFGLANTTHAESAAQSPVRVMFYVSAEARNNSIQSTIDTALPKTSVGEDGRSLQTQHHPRYFIADFARLGFNTQKFDFASNEIIHLDDMRYRLVAFVLHHQSMILTPHYVSCVKIEGEWHMFDDSVVREVNIHSLSKSYTLTSVVFERIDGQS